MGLFTVSSRSAALMQTFAVVTSTIINSPTAIKKQTINNVIAITTHGGGGYILKLDMEYSALQPSTFNLQPSTFNHDTVK